jgi:hypothetical protein
VECAVVVEKIWDVWEGCSIVKIFFVLKEVLNNGQPLPLLLYFYSPQNLIKWKSKLWVHRVLLALEVQQFEKEKEKISKKYAKMMEIHEEIGKGQSKKGWCMDPTHVSTVYFFHLSLPPLP